MSRYKIRTLSLCGATAMLLAASSVAVQAHSQMMAPVHQAHFTNSQLQAYARAAIQVQAIGRKAQAEFKSAKSNKARQAILVGIRAKEIQAVKHNGLTVQQYNAISTAGKTNPQVHTKIARYIKADSGR